jgi:hypothetical protein
MATKLLCTQQPASRSATVLERPTRRGNALREIAADLQHLLRCTALQAEEIVIMIMGCDGVRCQGWKWR